MPTIAELLDRSTAERLAVARAEAEQRQDEAKATPVQPVCPTCGQRRLPAPLVFRSAAQQAQYADPSRARA